MSAGSRKMPPPIVTLTMLAARAKVPMDRRREASDEEAPAGAVKGRNTARMVGVHASLQARSDHRAG